MKKTITFSELKEHLLSEAYYNYEDAWLKKYLEENPNALDKILTWVKSKNPNMPEAEQIKFAKNILKKKYREGKLDPNYVPANRVSREDEERFIKEIEFYEKDKYGKVRGRDDRWLRPETRFKYRDVDQGKVQIHFYKPVGFDENGNVKLNIFNVEYYRTHRYKDGDYDDGRGHEWVDVTEIHKVNDKKKVGETTGQIKDGKVVLSDGTILIGCGPTISWSWHEQDKWD